MKALKISLFFFLISGASFIKLQAQSCNTGANITADIWEMVSDDLVKFGCNLSDGEYYDCLESGNNVVTFINDLVRYWNQNANNSWSTIGPRKMEIGERYNGKLIGTSGRLFITPVPIPQNRVTITIKEKNGKAKTGVVVCVVDRNNQVVESKTRWFNNNTERKNDRSERRQVVLENTRAHLIKVHLDAKSATNTFEYELIVNGVTTISVPSNARKN